MTYYNPPNFVISSFFVKVATKMRKRIPKISFNSDMFVFNHKFSWFPLSKRLHVSIVRQYLFNVLWAKVYFISAILLDSYTCCFLFIMKNVSIKTDTLLSFNYANTWPSLIHKKIKWVHEWTKINEKDIFCFVSFHEIIYDVMCNLILDVKT